MTTTEGRIVTEGGDGSVRRAWFVGTVIVPTTDASLIGASACASAVGVATPGDDRHPQ
jgi:hypothetical protein